jgi:hypothetical protein
VTEALADPDAAVWHQEADLSDPDAPSRLIESAAATSRFLDILVCNHARSGGDGPMPGVVAYAASKGALASITQTLADQLAGRGITEHGQPRPDRLSRLACLRAPMERVLARRFSVAGERRARSPVGSPVTPGPFRLDPAAAVRAPGR